MVPTESNKIFHFFIFTKNQTKTTKTSADQLTSQIKKN